MRIKSKTIIKANRWAWQVFAAGVMLSFWAGPAVALQPSAVTSALTFHPQESGAGAPIGKLNVPAETMARQCITMVSPNYPPGMQDGGKSYTVVVRVVIWKSGNVSPVRIVSGPSSLEDEAMNTVRRWHYRPFSRDGEPLDVATEVTVNFEPGKSGGIVTHPSK